MKSYNLDYLLEDDDAIRNAIITCCKSKHKKKNGNNNKYYLAQRILNDVEHYVPIIKEILKDYKPSKVNSFEIIEKYAKKTRKITTVPLFPDQIIHQLIVDFLKPILMKSFYDHSYASIPGRGSHKAKKYVEKLIRRNPKDFKYVFKMDIIKCYMNISHNLLKGRFRKLLRGYKMYNLICQVIDYYHDRIDKNGDKFGIPIGFSTSQWFCNFILTPFDYYSKQVLKVKNDIRYMDDAVFTDSNKRTLHKVKTSIIKYLSGISFDIKKNYQVFRFVYKPKKPRYNKENKPILKGRFLDFLGFKFYRHKTVIRKQIFINIVKQSKQILERKSNVTFKMASSYISRFSYVKHTDSFKMFDKYLKKINIKRLKGMVRNESRKYAISCC